MQNCGFWYQLFIWCTCKIRLDGPNTFEWLYQPFFSLCWARLVIIKLISGLLGIVQDILACLKHCSLKYSSLHPTDSLFWVLYFKNNIGPARCTSSISSSFFVRQRNKILPAFWASSLLRRCHHVVYRDLVRRAIFALEMAGGREDNPGPPEAVHMELGSSYLADRMILAQGWSEP